MNNVIPKTMSTILREVHENNYEIEGELKERFINTASVIAEGARVMHGRFGAGTVIKVLGNYKVKVTFDKLNVRDSYLYPWTREVYFTNLISIDLVVRKEIELINRVVAENTTPIFNYESAKTFLK